MSQGAGRRAERAYAVLLLAFFAAVALWRRDLFVEAARVSLAVFARGGRASLVVIAQSGLFGAILLATLKEVSTEPEPRRDGLVVLLAGLAGWAAEAWGTRAGLWTYYTRETPPLWIVPAWPLGALFVERVGRRLRSRLGPAPAGAYAGLAAVAVGLVALFCGPRAAWPGLIAAALCLVVGARPEDDFWTLAAGMGCVLFADFWGTTNFCWEYYVRRHQLGLWRGIAFGMAFDAAVVLGALKAARAALTAWEAAAPPLRPGRPGSSRAESPSRP